MPFNGVHHSFKKEKNRERFKVVMPLMQADEKLTALVALVAVSFRRNRAVLLLPRGRVSADWVTEPFEGNFAEIFE
jgi:hypothetical protein